MPVPHGVKDKRLELEIKDRFHVETGDNGRFKVSLSLGKCAKWYLVDRFASAKNPSVRSEKSTL
jgi:hypothetical protein